MGAGQSSDGSGESFQAFYAALPDDTHDQIEALCAKDDARLLQAHPHAPSPTPAVPIGVTVRLSQGMAGAALATVPRLQRKHYELIPKALSEMDFWVSFFSHMTVVCQSSCPEQLVALTAKGDDEWKGNDPSPDAPNSFDAAWAALSDEQKAAVAALCGKESEVLLAPNVSASPPAFPALPLGMECFIDEAAATAALTKVPGLQKKQYALVPKKLDERAFWTNFFTHMTALVAPAAGGSA